ncbi:MAG: ANTAR domain-containing protein [Ruminococcus sp.]|nr:ANTAR domain-containing protein [Ruminococcus sp.]
MDSVLIVSGGKSAQTICALITEFFPDWKQSAAIGSKEARLLISQKNYDLAVINCPLPDGEGIQLAEHMCECSDTAVVLIVPSEEHEALSKKMAARGAAVIKKQPLNKAAFEYTLALAAGMRDRFLGSAPNAGKTDEELKNLGRAKLALMHYLKFTEQQAHRYLEKQAMDLRIPIGEAALRVIKMYDLEGRH